MANLSCGPHHGLKARLQPRFPLLRRVALLRCLYRPCLGLGRVRACRLGDRAQSADQLPSALGKAR